MPSRTTTMSISPGLTPASGLVVPGQSRDGRRFTYWSKSKRSLSSRPRSSTPGGTLGSPIAPSRMASWPASSSCDGLRAAPRRCGCRSGRPGRTRSNSTPGSTASITLRACAVTSVPMPSPATTAIRATLTSAPLHPSNPTRLVRRSRSPVRRSHLMDVRAIAATHANSPRSRQTIAGAAATKTRGSRPPGVLAARRGDDTSPEDEPAARRAARTTLAMRTNNAQDASPACRRKDQRMRRRWCGTMRR